jgi:hypothetical protein
VLTRSGGGGRGAPPLLGVEAIMSILLSEEADYCCCYRSNSR